MLNTFHLYHIPEFIFENGQAKAKFCIPIAITEESIVLFYLPTSQNFVPDNLFKAGCIKYKKRNIYCFGFKKEHSITITNYCFSKDTIISFQRKVHKIVYDHFIQKYRNTISDHGPILTTIKESLIQCIQNCPVIARGVKRSVLNCNSDR